MSILTFFFLKIVPKVSLLNCISYLYIQAVKVTLLNSNINTFCKQIYFINVDWIHELFWDVLHVNSVGIIFVYKKFAIMTISAPYMQILYT